MRKLIIAALATAVLLPASFLANTASAQVASQPASQAASLTKQNLLQLLEQDQLTTRYAAVRRVGGYHGGRAAVHRGGYRGAYRGAAYRGGYRTGVYRAGVARPYGYRYGYGYGRPYGYRYGYGYGRPYYRGAYYRPYYGTYRPYYGAAAAGLVTGSIAAQGTSAYCAQRFRSYNPATGTYTGYDGRQRRCP
ncbi:BA14K family protein [Microvirga sp. 2TAF3]|uniref:BA14K family protein n=1 Tax=Microvirga sp. 2TAF3 TaxID=3233014 RepID=UPI003F9C0F72